MPALFLVPACAIDLSEARFACQREGVCLDASSSDRVDAGAGFEDGSSPIEAGIEDGGLCFETWCTHLTAMELAERTIGRPVIDLERDRERERYTVIFDPARGDGGMYDYALAATGAELFATLEATPGNRVHHLDPFEVYVAGKWETRYLAMFVADHHGWFWWTHQPPNKLEDLTHPSGIEEGYRFSHFSRWDHEQGSLFAFVAVYPERGEFLEGRTSDFFLDLTQRDVEDALARGAIPLDITAGLPPLYVGLNVVFASRKPGDPQFWLDQRLTAEEVDQLAAERGAAIVNLETYQTLEGRRFTAIMRGSTPMTSTPAPSLAEISAGFDGRAGYLLRKVRGSTLAIASPDEVFEAGGSIAPLLAFHAARELEAGTVRNNTRLAPYLIAFEPCPSTTTTAISLLGAIQKTMRESDNATARGLFELFGREAIDATRIEAGMRDTTLLGPIGCEPNTTTLADLSRLTEKMLDTERARVTSYMSGNSFDHETLGSRMRELVLEEGASMTLTSTQTAEFIRCAILRYKTGRDGGDGTVFNGSISGWLDAPLACPSRCVASGDRYLFGAFIDGGSSRSDSETRYWQLRSELLRPIVREALQTFARNCQR